LSYQRSSSYSAVEEKQAGYSFPSKDWVYEVSLRTPAYSEWLKGLPGAHRLLQTLFQGELLGQYELLDFLIWPEGLFMRVRLNESSSLSNFLGFLKEKTTPSGEALRTYWDEELQWIKLVTPDDLARSTASFFQTVERVRGEVFKTLRFSPNLFFFYRNPRLNG